MLTTTKRYMLSLPHRGEQARRRAIGVASPTNSGGWGRITCARATRRSPCVRHGAARDLDPSPALPHTHARLPEIRVLARLVS